MNTAIKAECPIASEKEFLQPGLDFTQTELSEISNGFVGPVFKKMTPGPNGKTPDLSTDLTLCAQKVITRDYTNVRAEVTREQKTLSSIGGIGLYSDGSLENSSFDLMKDLERIHDIIFTKELPYSGSPNNSKNSVGALFANPPRSVLEGLTQ